MPSISMLLLLILLLAACDNKAGGGQDTASVSEPPEAILGISIEFNSADPESISVEEARDRSLPVINALVSPVEKRRRGALKIIVEGFNSRISGNPSKYKMMDRALMVWIMFASNPDAPKRERDAFVGAVNSIISFYDTDEQRACHLALLMFCDLQLLIQHGDSSNSLLQRWKHSIKYMQLIER